MAIIYVRKGLYEEIVRRNEDVTEFVNKAVEEALKKKKKEQKK